MALRPALARRDRIFPAAGCRASTSPTAWSRWLADDRWTTRAHPRLRDGEPPRRLERFNDDLLATLGFGSARTRTLRIQGAQGDEVQMWLVYPPGFDPRRNARCCTASTAARTPASGDTFHYRWNNQVFAAQGYVVACVNYHGSSGFGHDFLDSITHRWGELEQAGRGGRHRLAAERSPGPTASACSPPAAATAARHRVVAWMNGRVLPGRYQAYVCHAGCFDWVSMFADDAYTWFPAANWARATGGRHGGGAQSPHALRRRDEDADAGDPRRARHRVPTARAWPPTRRQGARRGRAAGVVPRREPLDPQGRRATHELWYGEFFAWLKHHAPSAEACILDAPALLQGPAPRRVPRTRPMLINFFYALRAAKLKVSVKEYLTLLEA